LRENSILIISSCSASKDDSISIPSNWKVISPSYYLTNEELRGKLLALRRTIFSDSRAQVGENITYAFDLYVRAGKAYKDILRFNYHPIKDMLAKSNIIEWFFLSGGFGIIHALEKAHKYQATFNYNIARQRDIPYTVKIWDGTLVRICDAIFSKLNPHWVYVFGSRDYTNFIKSTKYWKENERIRIFESTGISGANWINPILNKLVNAILRGEIKDFNAEYQSKFIKQLY